MTTKPRSSPSYPAHGPRFLAVVTRIAAASPSNVTTTGGTVNTIPLFTTATNIQNSILTQTGTTAVSAAGNLTATGIVTGSSFQIGSNLSPLAHTRKPTPSFGFAGNSKTTGTNNTASGVNALSPTPPGRTTWQTAADPCTPTPQGSTTRAAARTRCTPTPLAAPTWPAATPRCIPTPAGRTTRPAATPRCTRTRAGRTTWRAATTRCTTTPHRTTRQTVTRPCIKTPQGRQTRLAATSLVLQHHWVEQRGQRLQRALFKLKGKLPYVHRLQLRH